MSQPAPLDAAQITAGKPPDGDGFVRVEVSAAQWEDLARACALGMQDLLAEWCDGASVRMALISADRNVKAIATLDCDKGCFPSVGRHHAPAIRLERAMRDLHSVAPAGLPDDRPWLDHGVWPPPYASSGVSRKPTDYAFLPVEGEGLHQIPVGPVHAGIIEPGHFRFTANGETVVRLEERLGYVHKGIASLCAGKSIADAARIMARSSGDSTVAYSYAFALAVEAATATHAPKRASLLRAALAELERIAHHISDFGAVCNDASVVAIHANCALMRESVLQACGRRFGHRLMMDAIVPGGVAIDLDREGIEDLRNTLAGCERGMRQILAIYDDLPSLQDRTVSTGRVVPELVRRFAAGGIVGRASGRDFDCRRDAPYAPYDELSFAVPVRDDGDVNARVLVRAAEIEQSIGLLRQILDRLEPGELHAGQFAPGAGEGAALVEAIRGDLFMSVRLTSDGHIAHCHARDASWFQWPLLEAAIEGNIVADFPLCNKSFNCSYSGHDV